MSDRLIDAILRLYPRRVREAHGPEIKVLIEDLITHERRSPPRLFMRLALDGLIQRAASTATAWTVAAVLAATSFGGLAISDFAAANAPRAASRTVPRLAPAAPAPPSPRHAPRPARPSRRCAGKIARSAPRSRSAIT